MTDGSPNLVTFERALKRERNPVRKKHRDGGQHQELNEGLEQHHARTLVMNNLPHKKAQLRAQVKYTEGSQGLNTLGSIRPSPPPLRMDVPSSLLPLRSSKLPYNTPTALRTTAEELLVQLPDYKLEELTPITNRRNHCRRRRKGREGGF